MKTRVITAIIALIIFIPVLIFSDTLFTAVIAILSAIAVYEVTGCIIPDKILPRAVSIAFAAALPFAADNKITGDFMLGIWQFTAPIALLSICIIIISYIKKSKNNLLLFVFTVLYIAISFSAIVYYKRTNTDEYLYLLFFVSAWVSDTFAMFTGKFLGKHKLVPKLSPKKTVEGMLGGCIASVIATFAIEPQLKFIFIGLLLSLASQGGDLLASAIKRLYNIKDYGKIFPGHGGVMDRFDSVLGAVAVYNIFYCVSMFI